MRRAAVLLVAFTLFGGCHSEIGVFSPTGYVAPRYHYVVHYADPAQHLLMPADWEPDNLYGKVGHLHAKTGSDYQSKLYLDVNQDGTEDKVSTVQTYDLRFTNRRTAGVISLRTFPVDLDMKDKELRVLLDTIIENISGSGYDTVQLEGNLYLADKQHRYAAKIIKSGAAVLGGQPAYFATVDISNLDRLRVNPKAVDERDMLVLVGSGYTYDYGTRMQITHFPVLMMASYRNSPADFAASLPEFIAFLGRIGIRSGVGFKMLQQSPPPAPTPTPAAPPAPPKPAVEASSGPDAGSDAATPRPRVESSHSHADASTRHH
jgi:hypothetical protein